MYWFFLTDFNKIEFSEQIFEKYSNIKFHGNSSSESRAVVGGRTETDRKDEANGRFPQFPKRAKNHSQNNNFQICIVNVVQLITQSLCKSVMLFF
jgi:hypothetical protein